MMKPVDLQNGYKPMKRRLHSKIWLDQERHLTSSSFRTWILFRMPRQRHVGAAHKTEKIVR